MKIKLPRKRKKAYKKAKGDSGYMSMQITNEFLYEETGDKKNARFPEFTIARTGKVTIKYYW